MSEQTVIDHILLLKVGKNALEDDISRFRQATLSLKAIPGVIPITVGATFAEDWMDDRRNGKMTAPKIRNLTTCVFFISRNYTHPLSSPGVQRCFKSLSRSSDAC